MNSSKIDGIEAELVHSQPLLMLAHSRLEMRKNRPHEERVADEANSALLKEDIMLRTGRRKMRASVQEAR